MAILAFGCQWLLELREERCRRLFLVKEAYTMNAMNLALDANFGGEH